MKIRIIIVAAVKVLRDALANELQREAPAMEVLSTHGDARSALEAASVTRPAVIIVDRQLGIDAVRLLTSGSVPAKLIVLGIEADEAHEIRRWRAMGMTHAVEPDADIPSLIRAVQCSLGGPRLGGSHLAKGRARPTDRSAVTGVPRNGQRSLTAREVEVVELLQEGFSNKDIARALEISPATVKNHVHSILEKLELRRRGEIAAKLRREGGKTARA